MTKRVMYLYWGRKGLSRFVYEVAESALAVNSDVSISVSRQIENFAAFDRFGSRLFPVDTFASDLGVVSQLWKLPLLHRALARRLREEKIDTVIELMPHVWSTLVLSQLRKSKIRYATIIHDAEPHPGDWRTASVGRVLSRAVTQADVIFTLSETVSNRLQHLHPERSLAVHTLFHPDLSFGPLAPRPPRRPNDPLRVLWLGRILPYKGLPLFVEAIELLRQQNANIEVGVFGDGNLGPLAKRLAMLGCEVVNRWLTEDEIADILRRHDVMVLSHTEASQSGIAATALAAGMPIVFTPVGGLLEQVSHKVTGVRASTVSPQGVAEAISQLLAERSLYFELHSNVTRMRSARSMHELVLRLNRSMATD